MCELLILELNLADNDDDSVALVRLELEDVINTNSRRLSKIALAGYGSSDTVIPILNEYSHKYSIELRNILYFGRTPYSPDEIETIYALVSLREGTKGFECLSLINGTKYSWGIDVPHSIGLQIRRQLQNIAQVSISGDVTDVRTAITQAIELFSLAPSELLKAALKNATELVKKLVELETYFSCGNEARTLGTVASSKYYTELKSNNLAVLEAGYAHKDLASLQLPALTHRLEFIKAGIALSKSFDKCVTDKEMPRLFLWYSIYFLKLAQSYANRLQYTAALSLTMRALEIYCQGMLIKMGDGKFDGNGDFFICGKRSSGFADTWNAAQEHRLCVEEDLTSLIWRAIEVRNRSIFGHGVTHSNLKIFTDLNGAVIKVIRDYETKHAPKPVLWGPLRQQVNSNVFQEIDRSIASKVLMLIGIYLNGTHAPNAS